MLNYACLKKKSIWISLMLRIIVMLLCVLEGVFLNYRLPTPIYVCFVCFCLFSWMFIIWKSNQLCFLFYRKSKYVKKLILLLSNVFFPWLEIKTLFCSDLPTQVISLWQKDIYTSIVAFFENEFEVPDVKELLFELKKRGIVAQKSVTSKEEQGVYLDIYNGGNLLKIELSVDRLFMLSETNEKNGFDDKSPWKLIINSEGTGLFFYEQVLDVAWVDAESVAEDIANAISLLEGRRRK